MEEKIIYPLDGMATLNVYIDAERSNRYKAAKIKRDATDICDFSTRKAMREGVSFPWPCRIKFTWILKDKRKDPDNVAFAKKFILDGMQQAGFLKNDSLKYIEGFTDCFEVIRGVDEKVIVEVEV
ncbi:hypothetical protein [Eubacterium sp.]|uniref:hypothetical protein n=1 Tax=Eubacterium sp. TaxID=142586 RepID=UPI002FC69817